MKSFEFIKMHGLGNDFVIFDNNANTEEIKNKERLKKNFYVHKFKCNRTLKFLWFLYL